MCWQEACKTNFPARKASHLVVLSPLFIKYRLLECHSTCSHHESLREVQAGGYTEKLPTSLYRICPVDLPAPGARSTKAISWKSELNENPLFVFWILDFDKSSLRFPFPFRTQSQNESEFGWFFFCHSSHVCVCVCVSVDPRVIILLLYGPQNYLGNRFVCFCFINWHQSVLKPSNQETLTSLIMSRMTLGLLPRGPC